jgi:hypothetical protein
MKKLYFSALSIVFGFGLNAQTLTQANNAPANGELHSTYQCDSTFVPSAITGSNSAWTYSALVTHSSIVSNYTSVTTNNPGYPNADISVASSAVNSYYYKSTATDLKFFGGNLNLNGVQAQITYTVPAIYAVYPMSFGTTTTNGTSGTFTVTQIGAAGTFSGSVTVTADGTGTLALPAGTVSSVIRVVTSQTLNLTVTMGGSTGTVTQKSYNYYAPNAAKYPILSYVTSTVNFPAFNVNNSTQVMANVQKNFLTVGLNENVKEEISLNVYPNPSNSVVNFASENLNAKSVFIYDITGKMVESNVLTSGKLSLNVSNYNNGLYIYKLIDNSNTTLKTGKITVAH